MGDLKTTFEAFCNATKKDSKTATTKTIKKICEDCGLYVAGKFTSNNTDIIFSKVNGTKKDMDFEKFKVFLQAVATEKKKPYEDIEKAVAGKSPKLHGATKASKDGATGRLTDTSKYTGSHKERFDDSGKGKGLEGRKDFDAKAAEGYVGGYKGKDTYDNTH